MLNQNLNDKNLVTKKIRDYQDTQIWGTVFIGEQKQPFVMIYDTGSSWLWVNGRICANCLNGYDKFDERNSSTFSFFDSTIDLHYGSGDVYGYNSYDTVCLKPDACADNFSFLTVSYNTGFNTLMSSGLVGLSPFKNENHIMVGDLFVNKFRDTGAIDKAVFSLMIELVNNKSKMTFGGFDLENMAAPGSTV